jgi:hypothetical protein
MRKKIMTRIFLFLSVLVLLAPAPGLATTYSWKGGQGDWKTTTNWDPNGVPGVNDNVIIPNDGSKVRVSRNFELIHQLEVGGTSALNIGAAYPGAALGFQNAAKADDVLNNGTIRVGFIDGATEYLGNMSCWGNTVTLHGTGALVLGGHYPDDALTNSGWGGKFINSAGHTVRGGGYIQGLTVNQGQVIADNGLLWIQCPVDNTGGTMSASGSGNVLDLYAANPVTAGQINPQDGKVKLEGATLVNAVFGPGLVEVNHRGWTANFKNSLTLSSGTTMNIVAGNGNLEAQGIGFGPDNGNATLVNNGAIIMNGGTCYLGGSSHLTIQGAGSITMGGDGDNWLNCYDITLQPPQIIQGGGQVQNKVINNSTIIANNGTLSFWNGTIGAGTISVANGATLNLMADAYPVGAVQMGDLTMDQDAGLTVNDYVHVELKKNFSFAQTDPAKWSWGRSNNSLKMSGQGPIQTLEVGGQDFGASAAGLTNNFALPMLQVSGAGTQVKLVDQIDNGHRTGGGHEVLYVDTLEVLPGATLNLNGLKLYAYLDGTMHRVRAGEGSLFGGGKIIDKSGVGPLFLLLLGD